MIRIRIEQGEYADYKRLARFHYRTSRPGTVAGIYRAVVRLRCGREEVAGVVVVSYPVACCAERHRVFDVGRGGLRENLIFANEKLRSISRLVVHPSYRGLGLATRLVRHAMANTPTEFVEARSQLGRAMPVFEKAGMTRAEPVGEGRPAYYWGRGGG